MCLCVSVCVWVCIYMWVFPFACLCFWYPKHWWVAYCDAATGARAVQNVLNHMIFGLRKADGFLCMAEELNCLVFQEVLRPCNVKSLDDKGHSILHYAGDKKPYKMDLQSCHSCGYNVGCTAFCMCASAPGSAARLAWLHVARADRVCRARTHHGQVE